MLGRIKSIFDRIDEIHQSFRGIAPRRARREQQTFAAALNEATKTGPPQEPPPGTEATSRPEPGIVPSSRFGALNPLQTPVPGASTGGIATSPSSAAASSADLQSLIQSHATQNGVEPDLIRQIIQVESGFNPQAVSNKGAQGLMQLMPETARDMGVSDPFDPDQNIGGGTKYLAQLLQSHNGDLTKALASYNAGPGVVRQYGGVPPYPETRNFVKRVLQGLNKTDTSIE